MKFKFGDRVAVYRTSGRITGKIVRIHEGLLLVNYHESGYAVWLHPKQCRKLVKKKNKNIDELEDRLTRLEILSAARHEIARVYFKDMFEKEMNQRN
jgi:DNA repair exonuclease SbcCD ATPase subunit